MGLFDFLGGAEGLAQSSPLGMIMNYQGQQNANNANQNNNNMNRGMAHEFFQKQRDDSNTAHVREVADLKAAGLNPILSANKGAGMASGGTASSIPMQAQEVSMPSVYEMQQLQEQKKNNQADRDLKEAQAGNLAQQTRSLRNSNERGDFFGGLWRGFKSTRSTMDRIENWRKNSKNPWLSTPQYKPSQKNKNLMP